MTRLGRRAVDREHCRRGAAFPATVDGAVKDKGGLYGPQCRGEDGHAQARLLGDAVDTHRPVKDQRAGQCLALRHEEVDAGRGHDIYCVKDWTKRSARKPRASLAARPCDTPTMAEPPEAPRRLRPARQADRRHRHGPGLARSAVPAREARAIVGRRRAGRRGRQRSVRGSGRRSPTRRRARWGSSANDKLGRGGGDLGSHVERRGSRAARGLARAARAKPNSGRRADLSRSDRAQRPPV